jgi:hypothetical protein
LPGRISPAAIGKIATKAGFELLESLQRNLPDQFAAMTTLPELGPKHVKPGYDAIGTHTLANQRDAACGRPSADAARLRNPSRRPLATVA